MSEDDSLPDAGTETAEAAWAATFGAWLAEVAADPIVFTAGDPAVDEARGNMWSFSVSSERARLLTVDRVTGFVLGVMAARERQLLTRPGPLYPMLFYLWHDVMAGQLRFSLVTETPGRLPFGALLAPVDDPATIVRDWLESDLLDGIPFDHIVDVDPATADDRPEPPPRVLPVWSCRLPRSSSA